MYGQCDIPGCNEPTFIGWQPKSQGPGKQICRTHTLRHRDPDDGFDLFAAFGFIRSPAARIRLTGRQPDTPGLAERKSPAQKQTNPASTAKRQRPSRKLADRERICRACGETRQPGHTYCKRCKILRRKESSRIRRMRSYHKAKTM